MTIRDRYTPDSTSGMYARAIAGGASIHVAFDLAGRLYLVTHRAEDARALRQAVATEIGLSREDALTIEIGAYA